MRSTAENMNDDPFSWLLGVADVLNPARRPFHSVQAAELVALSGRVGPPPAALHRQWTQVVWRWDGEPGVFYLARCLGFHFSITQLSPTLAVECSPGSDARLPDGSCRLLWPNWRDDLAAERIGFPGCGPFRVAGLYTTGRVANYVEDGVRALPCAQGCQMQCEDSTSQLYSQLVPLSLGGLRCERCGGPLECTPSYSFRAQAVLESVGTGTRYSATIAGEENIRELALGRTIGVLFYCFPGPGGGSGAQTTLFVHSISTTPPLASTSSPSIHPFFLIGPCATPQRQLPNHMSFTTLCNALAPNIRGNETAKRALLLVAVHTCYLQRRYPALRRVAPLHTVLVGPPKSGKSSLLRALQHLYGRKSEYLSATVVRGGVRSGGLDAMWPRYSGRVLVGGAALLSDLLLLDSAAIESATPSALLSVRGLLERGSVEVVFRAGEDGLPGATFCLGGSAVFTSSTQVLLGMNGDSSVLPLLLPGMRLVVPLDPGLSMRDSASVGDYVVSSVSQRSRSASLRSLSLSSADFFGGSTATRCSPSPNPSSARDAAPFTFAGDTLETWVSEAPSVEELVAALERGSARKFYYNRLLHHVPLLEQFSGSTFRECSAISLPSPAYLRGGRERHAGGVPVSACMRLEQHVETLLALSLARLLIPCGPVEFTAAVGDELWDLYVCSLKTAARVRACGSGGASAPQMQTERPGVSSGKMRAPQAGPISSVPRLGKKKMLLHFKEKLRRQGGEGEVCSAQHAREVYDCMGGAAAFGDSLIDVMTRLEEAGFAIRRPEGWRLLGEVC